MALLMKGVFLVLLAAPPALALRLHKDRQKSSLQKDAVVQRRGPQQHTSRTLKEIFNTDVMRDFTPTPGSLPSQSGEEVEVEVVVESELVGEDWSGDWPDVAEVVVDDGASSKGGVASTTLAHAQVPPVHSRAVAQQQTTSNEQVQHSRAMFKRKLDRAISSHEVEAPQLQAEGSQFSNLSQPQTIFATTGFEGVYASGAGFGAELHRGTKRLRQTGFRSPGDAALERDRWLKSLEGAVTNQEVTNQELNDHQSNGGTPSTLQVAAWERARWLKSRADAVANRALSAQLSNGSTLEESFTSMVMCNFTPRSPSQLPTSKWVSYERLLDLFKPIAPAHVWRMGSGNLKQLIIRWYKDHPAFAGLKVNQWNKLLHSRTAGTRLAVHSFCFEYTPNGAAAIGAANIGL